MKFVPSALAFWLPMAAYLITLPPGITWAYHGSDGGDLITAACTLGIPHPPGYPTYTLLGSLMCRLPWGTPAWRLGLFSAVSAATAAWLVFKTVKHLTGSQVAGLLAAWSLATVPLVWSQAIIAEVYTVNLAFAGLLLWLTTSIRRENRWIALILGAVLGLALGTHLITLFFLPLIGLGFLADHRVKSRLKEVGWFLAGVPLGCSVFLYLPLRAHQSPITWGSPETWAGFWWLITGQLYHGYLFALPADHLIPRLIALVGHLVEPGVIWLTLIGFGLNRLWRYNRRWLFIGAITAALLIGYALGYNTFDSYVYLMPIFLLVAVSVGLGAHNLLTAITHYWWRVAAAVLLPAGVLIGGLVNGTKLDLRADHAAEDFWQQVMAQAPPEAVIISTEEQFTFALWYAHFVLGVRPDVAIVDTNFASYPWGLQTIRRAYPDLKNAAQLETLFKQNLSYHRPLCGIIETEKDYQWELDCHN